MPDQLPLPPALPGQRVHFDRSACNLYPGTATVAAVDPEARELTTDAGEAIPWLWVERWRERQACIETD